MADRSFNSIKVRLKQCFPVSEVIVILFQFHKGAIETARGQQREAGEPVFQFHKGAIETVSLAL